MPSNLNIIILNWNGTDDTIACIESILKSEKQRYNIIVIDNGSEEAQFGMLSAYCQNTFKYFQMYDKDTALLGGDPKREYDVAQVNSFEKITVIRNRENLGFSNGNNVGLKYLLMNSEDYVFLLNNDTTVEPEALFTLMDVFRKNKELVAVIPQIRYFNQKNKVWNCGGKLLWTGNRKYYFANSYVNELPHSSLQSITFATGCALILDLKVTGILSEKFFFGQEDVELSLRLKKKKMKIACVMNSIVYHKVGQSKKYLGDENLGLVYLEIMGRFINIRDYSNSISCKLKWMINLVYIIPMIRLRYKASYSQIFNIVREIIREIGIRTSITKQYYDKYLLHEF